MPMFCWCQFSVCFWQYHITGVQNLYYIMTIDFLGKEVNFSVCFGYIQALAHITGVKNLDHIESEGI